jgi:sRNA-binding protein
MWVWMHDHDLQGAPCSLLSRAHRHVQARQELLNQKASSSRTRKNQRWLARWRSRIEQEIARQSALTSRQTGAN